MSSDSEDEDVVRYGTPLYPYEEEEVPSKKKFQQQADQYAVDEHGRRRFHGAFTGGFSAGFQNSVGSAEGWTPAAFKSTRGDKAKVSSQRPEDFMDEEDRGDYGIAPRHMGTHSEFSGRKRARPRQDFDGPIPGEPVLRQLIQAVHETAAVRMLRSMGWKPGQGAGERLTRNEKRRVETQHKVYGCYMPEEMRQKQQNLTDEEDTSDSEYDFDTLFAPDDYEPYVLTKKSDRFGLGYVGLSRHSVLGNLAGEYGSEAGTSRSHLVMKDKGRKVSIRGQAFGVGAFEKDDEDIYATEDMSHYDFAIGGATVLNNKPIDKHTAVGTLQGFVKSTKPFPSVASYPPPALPRGYTPAPAGSRRTRFDSIAAPQRDQGLGRHELTPEARGALLGEVAPKPIEEQPQTSIQNTIQNSIQNTIQDPIAKLVGRNVNFVTTNVEPPKELDFISIKDTGNTIQKTFKPFANNTLKQARYERFLSDKASYVNERDKDIDNLSEWERDRELIEFEQAAKLYRPLTGEMGVRFTHASQPDDALNPLTAVAKSSTNYGLTTQEQRDAAEKGLYGAMTRKTADWRPESLVYKRFNVPEPHRLEPQKQDKPKVSYSIFSYLENPVHDKESFAREQSKFSGSKSLMEKSQNTDANKSRDDIVVKVNDNVVKNKETQSQVVATPTNEAGFSKRMTVAELFLKESEKDLKQSEGAQVTDTIEKFDKMDLYKSIFLSDSEEDEPAAKEVETIINFDDFVDTPKNVERNNSPPRGIFANINFDELNSWKRKSDAETSKTDNCKEKGRNSKEDGQEKNANSNKIVEETGEKIEADVYGPQIPENLQKRLETSESKLKDFRPIFRSKSAKYEVQELSSCSSDSWVDLKEVKTKKVKKSKKKKHKSKHKKSKHKKKDK